MKFSRGFVVIAAFAIALSGCAPEDLPAPTPTVSATPTTEPTAKPVTVAPAQVFDGECSRLFSEAEVSEMLGTSVTLQLQFNGPYIARKLEQRFGGIRCEWDGKYPNPGLTVLVVPSGVLAIAEQEYCAVDDSNAAMYCSVDVTANGIRISGAVSHADAGGGVSLQAEADKVEALFKERAMAVPAVPAPTPSATAWTSIPTCDELTTNSEIQALILADPVFVGPLGGDGGYVYLPAEQDLYFSRSGARPNCQLSGGEGYFIFSALGGGGWNEESLAELPGATREVVPGFDAVIVRPDSSEDMLNVDAFIDDNWISTRTTRPEATYPVLRALVALFS